VPHTDAEKGVEMISVADAAAREEATTLGEALSHKPPTPGNLEANQRKAGDYSGDPEVETEGSVPGYFCFMCAGAMICLGIPFSIMFWLAEKPGYTSSP
jgi:hypothetical protein